MFNTTDLNQLTKVTKKVLNPGLGLPPGVFKALCKIVPFVACEMVIVNNQGEFLLTFRKDKFWKGWHFPGGLMRYNESFESRLRATAKNELGVKILSYKFLFPINYLYHKKHNTRGHNVSLVFLCKILGKPKNGIFFKAIPKDIIFVHKELWRMAKKIC